MRPGFESKPQRYKFVDQQQSNLFLSHTTLRATTNRHSANTPSNATDARNPDTARVLQKYSKTRRNHRRSIPGVHNRRNTSGLTPLAAICTTGNECD